MFNNGLAPKWIENNNAMTLVTSTHGKRMRINIPLLKIDPTITQNLQTFLAHQSEVESFSVRNQTGSVLIESFSRNQHQHILEKINNFLLNPKDQEPPKRTFKLVQGQKHKNNTSDIQWHTLTIDQVINLLQIHRNKGLSSKQVIQKQQQFGKNKLKSIPPLSSLEIWFNQFKSLPVGLLGTAAALSVATGGLLDAAMIVTVIGANAVIGFRNDSQVEKTVHSLKKRKWQRQTVKRDGKNVTIATEDLVPGDIIYLKRGQMVPADCRVYSSEGLTVDESALTGEAQAVFKDPLWVGPTTTGVADRLNMLFKGTAITGGTCTAIVVSIGGKTQLGIIQRLMEGTAKPQTPIQKQMDHLGNGLSWASIGLCGLSFGIGILRRKPLLELFKSSVSLAVAAIPEGLPMVATTTLSRGVKSLHNKNLLVRNLGAVEALGNIHHLCLDKTGTITTDEMILNSIIIGQKTFEIPNKDKQVTIMLKILSLNNEVDISENNLNGSSTEKALVIGAIEAGIDINS